LQGAVISGEKSRSINEREKNEVKARI